MYYYGYNGGYQGGNYMTGNYGYSNYGYGPAIILVLFILLVIIFGAGFINNSGPICNPPCNNACSN